MSQQKRAEQARARKKRQNLRRTGYVIVIALVIVGLVLLVSDSGSGKKSASGSTTTTSTTAATTTSTSAGSTTSTAPTTTFAAPTTQPLTSAAVAPTCPSANESERIVWFTKAPPDCIGQHSVWEATFDTSEGKFVVKMPAASSYAAVNNFVFLARWNYYNGTFFHRVIPGFVIQGGDPTGLGTGGTHGFPGYSFTGNYPPESCTKTPTAACYQPGDFVMANSNSDPQEQNASTDGSQFFVVLPGGQTQLDTEPTYTIFGKVVSGMGVVEKIGLLGTSAGTPTVKVYVLKVTVTELSS